MLTITMQASKVITICFECLHIAFIPKKIAIANQPKIIKMTTDAIIELIAHILFLLPFHFTFSPNNRNIICLSPVVNIRLLP